jgi:nicotinamidase/pyrazinamidase
MKRGTVFWDVDTQYDFMDPRGKLYVPGAEHIIDAVSEVRRFALENGFSIIASTDFHSADNPEISDTPDFRLTFPLHCMAGEAGSERVGWLGELPIDCISTDPMDAGALRVLIDRDQFHIVIRKESVDVFSNPNTVELVKLIEAEAVAVFGVALDICVYHTVHMLRKACTGETTLYLLKDVVKGLEVKPEAEILEEIRQMGVEITEFSDFKRRLQCG